MHRDPEDALAGWMVAEQAGEHAQADTALHDALQVLPRRAPRGELSDRLMRMAVVRRPAAVRAASERLVAAGVIAAALAMTLMPVGVVGAFLLADPARIVSWLARVCVWLTEWMNAGVSVWTLLARTGDALGHAANSPFGSAALTITLLVASTALLVLNRYLPTERS